MEIKERLKTIVEKINIIVCIIILIVLMTLPIIYMALFSVPVADDFDNSLNTKIVVETVPFNIFDVLKVACQRVVDTYNSWQGTYTSVFLMAIQPGVFGEQYYFITTWALIIVTLFSFLYFGKTLLSFLKVDTKTALFLSLLVWYFIIQTIPDIKEGLFWYNGAMHYMLFLCLTMVLFASLIKQYNVKSSKLSIIVCSIGGFLISGGNQLTAFLNILLMILFVGYILIFDNKNKSNIKPILFPLVSSIIGFVIMLIAPGNAVRREATREMVIEYPTVFETITASAISYFKFAIENWTSFSFLLFLVLLTPFIINITKKINGFSFKVFSLLTLSQYAVICGMMCTIYLGVGHFGAGRVTNVLYLVFVVSMIVLYGYLIGLLQQKEIIKVDFSNISKFSKNIIGGVCSLAIFIGIFFLGSTYYQYSTSGMALAEIYGGTTAIYSQQMEQRFEMLNDDSIKEAVLEPHITSVFFGEELLEEDSSLWPNTTVSEFYGKQSVSIVKEKEFEIQ